MLVTFCIVFSTIRRYVSEVTTIAIASVICGVLLAAAVPRPQIISFAMFAFFLRAVLLHVETRDARYLFALPLLMIPWANAHGGFMGGLILVAVSLVAQWMHRESMPSEAARTQVPLRPLALCLVACVLAALVNPYHFGLLAYPFKVSAMWSTRAIDEWMSPELRNPGSLAVVMLAFSYLVAQVLRDNRPHPIELLLPMTTMVMAMDSRRHLTLAALTLGPAIAMALADGSLRRGSATLHALRSRVPFLSRMRAGTGKDLGSSQYALNGALLIVAAAVGAIALPAFETRAANENNKWNGMQAIDFMARNGIAGRGFNEYGFGGYHMYRIRSGPGVFIDGRADTFGDDHMRKYGVIYGAQEGWKEALAEFDIEHVVVSRAAPIRQVLVLGGEFEEVYTDADNAVLVRRDKNAFLVPRPAAQGGSR
jgi:hypothetical protein